MIRKPHKMILNFTSALDKWELQIKAAVLYSILIGYAIYICSMNRADHCFTNSATSHVGANA